MVKDRVLEDLFDVLVANLGRVLTRGAQVLAAIDCKVYLRVSKILWLVIGEQKDGAVSHTSTHLSSIPALFIAANDTFVKVYASYNFFVRDR